MIERADVNDGPADDLVQVGVGDALLANDTKRPCSLHVAAVALGHADVGGLVVEDVADDARVAELAEARVPERLKIRVGPPAGWVKSTPASSGDSNNVMAPWPFRICPHQGM